MEDLGSRLGVAVVPTDVPSAFSPACRWRCWSSRAQSPRPRSRSTRLGATGCSTQSLRLPSYRSWSSSRSAGGGRKEAGWRRSDEEEEEERETCTHLALHVHDDHCVGAVAHHKMLRILGQQDDVVDRDVGAGWRPQRLEGAAALGGLHVPHLLAGNKYIKVVGLREKQLSLWVWGCFWTEGEKFECISFCRTVPQIWLELKHHWREENRSISS